jgi:hypothetical protein
MMQKGFKQLMLLAAFVPGFAMAQALQNQTPAPADNSTAAAAPVDPAKQAAIKDLLDAIDAQKLVAQLVIARKCKPSSSSRLSCRTL